MLKPLVSKFSPDLSSRSKDITENQVPAKLKPIVIETPFTPDKSIHVKSAEIVHSPAQEGFHKHNSRRRRGVVSR